MNRTENEVWKAYPEFDWIQASNRGGYRTIDRVITCKDGKKRTVKGHDLTPRRMKNGYMQLFFKVNGKTIFRLAHRVTAETFIPNHDNLPQVNHKNCIRDDNRVENLEWCTASYNRRYTEKYGVSATECQGHPLFAVVLKTGEVLHFRSQCEASRELGVAQRDIQKIFKGKLQQAGGYYFTENKNEITKEKIQSIKDNMNFWGGVIAISMKEQKPSYFKSQTVTAHLLGVNNKHINDVLKSRRKTTGGYWFTYADSNAIESVRREFGDSTANKVAELLKDTETK